MAHSHPRGANVILNDLSRSIFYNNCDMGWWDEASHLPTSVVQYMQQETQRERPMPVPNKYLVPTKLALAHSELSEALEGFRKNLMDDHLPNRPMIEVELADTIIRILDLAGYLNLDIGGAVLAKLAYNATREDHKREVRAAPGGKNV